MYHFAQSMEEYARKYGFKKIFALLYFFKKQSTAKGATLLYRRGVMGENTTGVTSRGRIRCVFRSIR